jgi:hypothetical protein
MTRIRTSHSVTTGHRSPVNQSIRYTVSITRTSDGKTVELHDLWGDWPGYVRDAESQDSIVYMWDEGNYCCDCNRQMYFLTALGETPAEFGECGFTAYKVNWLRIDEPDGKLFVAGADDYLYESPVTSHQSPVTKP